MIQRLLADENFHGAIVRGLLRRIDGQWQIAFDIDNRGRQENWFEAPLSEACLASVPSALQETFPNYHGVVWYWKTFHAPANPDPQGRFLLRFWSVDYKADVWVNGKFAGSHVDAEEPFVFDVTEAVLSQTENLLAVRVLNPTNKRIEVDATIVNAAPDAALVRLGLIAAPATGGEISTEAIFEQSAASGRSLINGRLRVSGHRLWDLDDPYLYRITARLNAADEYSVRVGFRHFDFDNGYFRLNGRRIFLRSAHSLWTTPIKIHSSQDLPKLRRDILCAKTMGFNMIRFHPFAGARCQLDLCDELGVMIAQQAASSWCMLDSPEMPANFDRSLLGVVGRDRNHPSVVMWYFLNETADGPCLRRLKSLMPNRMRIC